MYKFYLSLTFTIFGNFSLRIRIMSTVIMAPVEGYITCTDRLVLEPKEKVFSLITRGKDMIQFQMMMKTLIKVKFTIFQSLPRHFF